MKLAVACFRVLLAVAIVAIVAIGGQFTLAAHAESRVAAVSLAANARLDPAAASSSATGQADEAVPGDLTCGLACPSGGAHPDGSSYCGSGLLIGRLPDLLPIVTVGDGYGMADSIIAGTDPTTPHEPPRSIV